MTINFTLAAPPTPCLCDQCRQGGFDDKCRDGQWAYVDYLERLSVANGIDPMHFFTVRKFRALAAGEPRDRWVGKAVVVMQLFDWMSGR